MKKNAEDADVGGETQASKEGDTGESIAPEQTTSNESGISEPDQVEVTSSHTNHEDQEVAEDSIENNADDQGEKEAAEPSVHEKETAPHADDTAAIETDDTRAADISKSESEDVKNTDGNVADGLAEDANEAKNPPEDQKDSDDVESSSKNISFAPDVKGPKPTKKAAKSKRKGTGKDKASSVDKAAQKKGDKAEASFLPPENDSRGQVNPIPDMKSSKDTKADKNVPVSTKAVPKKSEGKMTILGKQGYKKTKKPSKKKDKDNRVKAAGTDDTAKETLQEDPEKPKTESDTTHETEGAHQEEKLDSDDKTLEETPNDRNEDVKHDSAGR